MDRIGKALEKAQGDRLEPSVNATATKRWLPVAEADLPEHIVYTQTRSVDVPAPVLRDHRIVSGLPRNAFTDAFKILSTQISQILRANNWNTLGVTSAGRQEGKTMTAINLAISLSAEFHQTTLLVDANLREPGVSERFDMRDLPGLSDYLMAQTPIEDLLINPGVPGFVVLPSGAPLANSSEALGWRRMADLVVELKTRYRSRIVVFDLPPALGTADVLAFAPCIDAALLVVEEGKTTRSDVRRAAEHLRGTHLIGTVLNKSNEVRSSDSAGSGLRRSWFKQR